MFLAHQGLGARLPDPPTSQLTGLLTWFDHAIADLRVRDTPDPAGVAAPIKTKMPRAQLVDKLIKARDQLAYAIELEAAGYDVLARDELAKFFNDEAMLPREDQGAVVAQEITRRRRIERRRSSAPTLITGFRDRQHPPPGRGPNEHPRRPMRRPRRPARPAGGAARTKAIPTAAAGWIRLPGPATHTEPTGFSGRSTSPERIVHSAAGQPVRWYGSSPPGVWP